MQNLVNRIRSQDMIIALSYSGQDEILIDFIQRVFLKERPYLLSITRADNNPLESLSDANFYVFADQIRVPGMDLTSNVPMLMIIEMLIYEYMSRRDLSYLS
jgi:RpiR family glv operon transcriptional regulator